MLCYRIVPIKLASATADQSSASYSWQNCSSPHSYSGLQGGHWSFSMTAIDVAGLQQMTGCASTSPLTSFSYYVHN